MSIAVRDVRKRFGTFEALKGVSLEVAQGELVALLGPSGSGKTTLLRIVAGLEPADAGSVLFEGRDVTHTGARDRGVGFVFQHYALFRHMNVAANIAFGLEVKRNRRPREDIDAKVRELLELVQLTGYEKRYPSQLSGGQRQRVALARALAIEPRVLLLDEPFGALDAQVRKDLRRWLRRLHDDLGITGLFVTHDQDEALEVADRIVVMNAGAVEQTGTPAEIQEHPATPFVCQFIGEVNKVPCRVSGGEATLGPLRFSAPAGRSGMLDGFARPEEVEILPFPAHGLPAHLRRVNRRGVAVDVELEADGLPLKATLPRAEFEALGLDTGDAAAVGFRKMRFF